jgi:hypothetical protein
VSNGDSDNLGLVARDPNTSAFRRFEREPKAGFIEIAPSPNRPNVVGTAGRNGVQA